MTLVDKIMMCRLLSFATKVTEAYDSTNLANVYNLTKDFVVATSKFYLEFSRDRIYNQPKDSLAYKSSIQVYANLIIAIL